MTAIPDYLRPGLDLVIVGINPGTRSAAAGRHYAGPGNHFWPLLHESGLVTEPLTFAQDERVLEWGIGLTNLVDRAVALDHRPLARRDARRCGGAARQTAALRAAHRLLQRQAHLRSLRRPRLRSFGLQPERIGDAQVFVMPSTSARAAAYQRADKLRFFIELRDLVRAEQRQAVAS